MTEESFRFLCWIITLQLSVDRLSLVTGNQYIPWSCLVNLVGDLTGVFLGTRMALVTVDMQAASS